MGQPFLGQITMFAGTFQIAGWALCNGQLLDIGQNAALYNLIGTTYGGDGVTTFALPNLQSRVAIHQGTGQGLSTYVIGQLAGTENVTLNTQQIPQHNHTFSASGTTATSGGQTPTGSTLPGRPSQISSGYLYVADNGVPPAPSPHTLPSGACSMTGGNIPHANLMPTLCVTYLIALQGIYPSQS
jgi:microcystin-dependent protein